VGIFNINEKRTVDMTQYHVKIWETAEYGMELLSGSRFPRNASSMELDIEAHTIEAAMKLAMLETSFKRVARLDVLAVDWHEAKVFPDVRKDNEGRITYAGAEETTPEYRAPGIFMKSDLN
jgi:hypothetical protein